MTYGEIKNKDYEERERLNEQRNSELLDELTKGLNELDYKISNVSIDFEKYDEAGSIEYDFELSDGYKDSNSIYWGWGTTVTNIIENIKKKINYVKELREQYPEYAKINDYIQKYRVFNKSCKLKNNVEVEFSAELCDYLKLPNTTKYSVGGGDCEIKHTPKRVEDFNNNIDKLCLFLTDCVSELRSLRGNEMYYQGKELHYFDTNKIQGKSYEYEVEKESGYLFYD